ncbi:MAG: LytTR family DNA-binding domain-containing protein [Alphaproteobacteria bacterium]|nr:LytTR family DNA-binding domain-containing protein [Alphaproteobacteria bacterium]
MAVDRPDGGEDTFFACVPPHNGSDLLHLRMRDHYIEVTTATGRDLVLMRFTDALASLPASLGGRVHRTHWVAWSHVAALIRHRGRLAIHSDNGGEVSVSRGYAKAFKARLGPPRG